MRYEGIVQDRNDCFVVLADEGKTFRANVTAHRGAGTIVEGFIGFMVCEASQEDVETLKRAPDAGSAMLVVYNYAGYGRREGEVMFNKPGQISMLKERREDGVFLGRRALRGASIYEDLV